MQLPETAEQLRTAPMRALRAVFAGIGQLLVAADRFREEAEDQAADDHYDVFREWGRPAVAVPPAGTEQAAEPAAPAPEPDESAVEAAAVQAASTAIQPAAKARTAAGPARRTVRTRPEQQRHAKPARKRPEKPSSEEPAPGKATMAAPEKLSTERRSAEKPAPEKAAPERPTPRKKEPAKKEPAAEESSKKESGRPAGLRATKSAGKTKRGTGPGGGKKSRPGAAADAPGKTGEAADTATDARRPGAKARGPATTMGATRMGAENTMRSAKARGSRAGAEPRRFRSLDSTGNVRLLSPEDAAELAAEKLATAEPADSRSPDELAASDHPAEPTAAGLATSAVRDLTAPANQEPPSALPIAAYDDLSLPSLRSRLRTLDTGQLRILLDYERSNARRDDVMGMFERRITKLGAASSDAT